MNQSNEKKETDLNLPRQILKKSEDKSRIQIFLEGRIRFISILTRSRNSAFLIDIIIKPAYLTAIQVFPKLNFIEGNLDRNKEQWQKLADEYDEKM